MCLFTVSISTFWWTIQIICSFKKLSYIFYYRCSLTYYGVMSQLTRLKLKTYNVHNAFKTPNLYCASWLGPAHLEVLRTCASARGRAEPPAPRTRSRAWGFGLVTVWPVGSWGWCPRPASLGSIASSATRSKFKVQFPLDVCLLHTIVKSKNCKSKWRKAGTICT